MDAAQDLGCWAMDSAPGSLPLSLSVSHLKGIEDLVYRVTLCHFGELGELSRTEELLRCVSAFHVLDLLILVNPP